MTEPADDSSRPANVPVKAASAHVLQSQVQRRLPFLMRYPVIAGAIFGLLLRLMFSGRAGSSWSAMAIGFIYFAPVAIGVLTVYLAERQSRRSWAYDFFAPALATLLFVGGSVFALIEGVVCAIIIAPMFAGMGGLAGLIMGLVCRLTR